MKQKNQTHCGRCRHSGIQPSPGGVWLKSYCDFAWGHASWKEPTTRYKGDSANQWSRRVGGNTGRSPLVTGPERRPIPMVEQKGIANTTPHVTDRNCRRIYGTCSKLTLSLHIWNTTFQAPVVVSPIEYKHLRDCTLRPFEAKSTNSINPWCPLGERGSAVGANALWRSVFSIKHS